MSCDFCLFFFGIRFSIFEDDIEALEERTHPIMIQAQSAALQYYWANFGGHAEKCFLFVGRNLGILGREDLNENEFFRDDLDAIAAATRRTLVSAGFSEEPRFYLQWAISSA